MLLSWRKSEQCRLLLLPTSSAGSPPKGKAGGIHCYGYDQLHEEIDTYYFVSISYPFMSSDMNERELFMSQAKQYFRGNEMKGDFVLQCVETENRTKHKFFLFEFETSRATSNAKANDFVYSVQNVDTDEILCNISTHLCIDFRFTTTSAANAAIHSVYQAMLNQSKDDDGMVRHHTLGGSLVNHDILVCLGINN